MAQQIFTRTRGGISGPHSAGDIREMARQGTLLPSDQISFDRKAWREACELKGLEFAEQPEAVPKIDLAKTAGKVGKSMISTLQGAAGVVSSKVTEIQANREIAKQEQSAVKADSISALQRFLNDAQEPKIIESTVPRIQQFLTSEEELLYLAVQKKPVATIAPDCVALTSRRVIFFTVKLLGQLSFQDHLWRNVSNATVKEGILGSTFSATVTNGQRMSVDYLPKAQARMLYRFAQEMEEKAFEERRTRTMEETRAAAGGVVVQNAFVPPEQARSVAPAEDPMASLQKLKAMFDAELISADEFASKKTEILKRM